MTPEKKAIDTGRTTRGEMGQLSENGGKGKSGVKPGGRVKATCTTLITKRTFRAMHKI